VRNVRDVLLQHAVHPARARLRAARGGPRIPSGHRGRDGLPGGRIAGREPRRGAGEPGRPRSAPSRPRPPARAAAPAPPAPPLRLWPRGMAPVSMPLTLMPPTAPDTSAQGLASGLFNTSQQVGGALGLAILSTLATSKMGSAGGTPAHALVVGFHWAFAAGAV